MTKQKEFNYAEAIAEVEQILGEISADKVSVDELEKRVKRATELIEACHAKLDSVEEKVEKALQE